MERQPVFKLAEFQRKDVILGSLIDKRQALLENAQSWNITREDPDIEAAARNHARMLVEKTIPDSITMLEQRRMSLRTERSTYIQEHAPELVIQAEPAREAVLEVAASLPPLLQRLRPIPFKFENPKPGSMDLIDNQLRTARRTEQGQLTDAQKQLPEDVAFIATVSTTSDYKRVITPEELHAVVTKVREYIQTSPDGEKTEFPLDFQRRVVEFAGQYTGYSGNITKEDVQKAQASLKDNTTPKTISRFNDFAETASMRLRQTISSSDPNQSFRIKVDRIDAAKTAVYQAALDVACYDIYRGRNITPQQKNLETWKFNRYQISEWQMEARSLLTELRRDERIVVLIDQLEEAIFSMVHRTPTEHSDRYAIGNQISLQLKIGHLVDNINNKLVFLRVQEVERRQSTATCATKIATGDAIPGLLAQLDHITSSHLHKYNLDNTVGKREQEAQSAEPGQRTPEQQQLLEDIAVLAQFTSSEAYKNVFSPDELHQLVAKLQLLSQKNRPDFNEVEDRILGLLDEKARIECEEKSDRLVGVEKRADKDSSIRRGMQWGTLNDFASEALSVIWLQMMHRFSIERGHYFIPVQDPQPEKNPDLTPVYQLVADMHALDIMGQRSKRVDSDRQEIFVSNCRVVNEWYAEFSQIMCSLPDDPQIRRLSRELREMIKTMNVRLEDNQLTGFNKDYKLDPAGAISLQKKIGHTVEQLKAAIDALGQPGTDEGEIIPLE